MLFFFSAILTKSISVANVSLSKREAIDMVSYSYRPTGLYGQYNWPKYFPRCGGKKQSPINIELNKAKPAHFRSTLRTTNIDTKPLGIEMRNNGYTAYVKYDWACCAPRIYGGPLLDVYVFDNIHFHWGQEDSPGTEHRVDGKTADLEGHMVFINTKYETKEEALEHTDGMCIFTLRYFVISH